MPEVFRGRRGGVDGRPDGRVAVSLEGSGAIGKQGHVPRALDGFGDHALMFGASAGLAARADLAPLGDVAAEQIGLLVVERPNLLGAKLADADFADETPSALLAFFLFAS